MLRHPFNMASWGIYTSPFLWQHFQPDIVSLAEVSVLSYKCRWSGDFHWGLRGKSSSRATSLKIIVPSSASCKQPPQLCSTSSWLFKKDAHVKTILIWIPSHLYADGSLRGASQGFENEYHQLSTISWDDWIACDMMFGIVGLIGEKKDDYTW